MSALQFVDRNGRLRLLDWNSGLRPWLAHHGIELQDSLVLDEQNARMALGIADTGYIIENGRFVMKGKACDLMEDKDVKEFYMGVTRGGGRKSFKDVKSYKRRKRWM